MVEDVARPARPLKHVVIREYVRMLLDGADVGDPAPSERDLVERFGVARMTVRQAIDSLVTEGVLMRSPGRGTFVARPRRTVGRLLSFTEDMERRGFRAESHTMLLRREQAGRGVARALGITPGDAVIHWKRRRDVDSGNGARAGSGAGSSIGSGPMAVDDAYLNEILLPGFLQAAEPRSLFVALAARGLRPTWAEDSVNSELASAEDAATLQVEPGAPLLVVARRVLAVERPVAVSRTAFRADRYTMWVQLGEET